MKNLVEIKEGKIIMDLDFFNRMFIRPSIELKEPLRGLSLRLMALLIQKLDIYEARRLPPRSQLSKELGVSTTAINNSLIELEEAKFLYEYNVFEHIVTVDGEDKDRLESIKKAREEDRKTKRFSGEFKINYNFNKTDKEQKNDLYESLREVLGPNLTIDEFKKMIQEIQSSEEMTNIKDEN